MTSLLLLRKRSRCDRPAGPAWLLQARPSEGIDVGVTAGVLVDPPPEPSARPELWAQIAWDALPELGRGVYEWRSRALHDGVPMPAPMCTPPIIFGGAPQEGGGTAAGYGGAGGTWTGRDIPMMLHVFAHVVRGCVLEWWRRATGNSAALPADRPRLRLPSGSC